MEFASNKLIRRKLEKLREEFKYRRNNQFTRLTFKRRLQEELSEFFVIDKIKCDHENNTADVIDRGSIFADVYITNPEPRRATIDMNSTIKTTLGGIPKKDQK